MPKSLSRSAARSRGVRWTGPVVLALVSGCAGGTGGRLAAREPEPAARILLTAPELEKYRGANSLMEALDSMNPAWLTSSGPEAQGLHRRRPADGLFGAVLLASVCRA